MDATETAANTAALADVEAIAFLDRALAMVDSSGTRAWARSESNHSVWIRIARSRLDRGGSYSDERRLAASIVTTAMGM